VEYSIREVRETLGITYQSSKEWAKVCSLEREKEERDLELFNADDSLLGDSYDKEKVAALKECIRAIDEQLSRLESNSSVAAMRVQEKMEQQLLERNQRHQNLMRLSENEPSTTLKEAVILSSNPMCGDCEKFKAQVNTHFGLNIEMTWCG
jgi:hypothetical protein